MLHNRGTVIENHERFVARVAQMESVWGIEVEDGFATCDSHGGDGAHVIIFWSDRAYAKRALEASFPGSEVVLITLFDFLFRWLPGMEKDGVLAGTNWTKDMAGLELRPVELQTQILEALPEEAVSRFRRQADF